jgi:hypothetical protein
MRGSLRCANAPCEHRGTVHATSCTAPDRRETSARQQPPGTEQRARRDVTRSSRRHARELLTSPSRPKAQCVSAAGAALCHSRSRPVHAPRQPAAMPAKSAAKQVTVQRRRRRVRAHTSKVKRTLILEHARVPTSEVARDADCAPSLPRHFLDSFESIRLDTRGPLAPAQRM